MVSIVVANTVPPFAAVLMGPVVGTRAPVVVAPALSIPCIVPLTEAVVIVAGAVMALILVVLVVFLIVAHSVM